MTKRTELPFRMQRMKILRVPSLMYNYSGIPPFGLATITAMLLEKGYRIEQDDLDAKCAADELFPRNRWGKQFPAKDLLLDIERVRRFWSGDEDEAIVEIIEQVLSYTELDGIHTVLLSCIEGDDPSAVLALCMGKYLRESGVTVIVGGEAFPHMMPIKSEIAYFYDNGCFDYYIQGYGEVPLLELFERLDKDLKLDDVSGLVFGGVQNTEIENRPLFTRPEVIPDFDGLPMHLYYKFPDDWGSRPTEDDGVDEILILPVKLNYCCPMNCAFCISSGDAFSKVTWMGADQVAKGIKGLKEKYDTLISCLPTTSSIFREICRRDGRRLHRKQVDICGPTAPISSISMRLCYRKSKRQLIGQRRVGEPKMQKLINKRIDSKKVSAFSVVAKLIYNSLEIIAGLPGETDEDTEHTVRFLHEVRPYVDQMYLNPFSLITGSLMHKKPEAYGITNVKPVATIFQRKPDEVYSWIQRYTFDEVDGLKWKDKIQQIERSYRRLHQTQLELDLGGHDLHTLFQRFTKFGAKHLVADFQTSRAHQGFDYFGRDGQRGHSPAKSVVSAKINI